MERFFMTADRATPKRSQTSPLNATANGPINLANAKNLNRKRHQEFIGLLFSIPQPMSSTIGGGMSISNPSATNSPLIIEINGPNNDRVAKPSRSTRTRQSHRTNAKTDLIEVASPQPYNQTTSKKVIQCPDTPISTDFERASRLISIVSRGRHFVRDRDGN
jgi:hypothetical protein